MLSIFLVTGCGEFNPVGEWRINRGDLSYYEPTERLITIGTDYFDNGKVKSPGSYEIKEFPNDTYMLYTFHKRGNKEKYVIIDDNTMMFKNRKSRMILIRE